MRRPVRRCSGAVASYAGSGELAHVLAIEVLKANVLRHDRSVARGRLP